MMELGLLGSTKRCREAGGRGRSEGTTSGQRRVRVGGMKERRKGSHEGYKEGPTVNN
jgi:hypothetical protein